MSEEKPGGKSLMFEEVLSLVLIMKLCGNTTICLLEVYPQFMILRLSETKIRICLTVIALDSFLNGERGISLPDRTTALESRGRWRFCFERVYSN